MDARNAKRLENIERQLELKRIQLEDIKPKTTRMKLCLYDIEMLEREAKKINVSWQHKLNLDRKHREELRLSECKIAETRELIEKYSLELNINYAQIVSSSTPLNLTERNIELVTIINALKRSLVNLERYYKRNLYKRSADRRTVAEKILDKETLKKPTAPVILDSDKDLAEFAKSFMQMSASEKQSVEENLTKASKVMFTTKAPSLEVHGDYLINLEPKDDPPIKFDPDMI